MFILIPFSFIACLCVCGWAGTCSWKACHPRPLIGPISEVVMTKRSTIRQFQSILYNKLSNVWDKTYGKEISEGKKSVEEVPPEFSSDESSTDFPSRAGIAKVPRFFKLGKINTNLY